MGSPGESGRSVDEWETLLLEHARRGEPLELAGPGVRPDAGQDERAAWPAARHMPASALRTVLLRLEREPTLADPRGLLIVGAEIADLLDLEGMALPCRLGLFNSRLRAGADMADIHVPALSLRGSHLHPTAGGERALSLDRAHITGDVFLDNGFKATGLVTIRGATIGGHLGMSGATLTNVGDIALALDGARITGDVFLDDGFEATGEVRAYGATFDGQLSMSRATLRNEHGERVVLILQDADVSTVYLRGLVVLGDGVVDLNTCRIGTLTLNRRGEGSGVPPGRLIAHGWHITTLYGAIAADADLAQKWLASRPQERAYSPQPARALAHVYEESGHPDQARKLRYAAAKEVRRELRRTASDGKPSRSHLLGHRARLAAYQWLVGYGYYPLRTAWWLMGFFVAALVVAFLTPDLFEPADPVRASEAAIIARDSAASADPGQEGLALDFAVTGATPCDELGTYPCFRAWPYALQTVIPPASAIQVTAWQPTEWVLIAMTVFKAAGWILVVLFLASISGLLRRT